MTGLLIANLIVSTLTLLTLVGGGLWGWTVSRKKRGNAKKFATLLAQGIATKQAEKAAL